MKRKLSFALIFVIAVMTQLLFALPAFAESKITTESTVKESKMVLKVADDKIKVDEVEVVFITVGEKEEHLESFIDNVSETQTGANPKVVVANDVCYRIYDGYIQIELLAASDVARGLGTDRRDILVEVVLTSGEKLDITGTIKGVFKDSSETPATGSDDESKFLFLDYQYTHSDVANGGHWAYDQVKFMKSIGVVKGTTEGKLFPNSYISLKEFIAMLSRTMQHIDKANDTSSDNIYRFSMIENKYDEWVKDDYSALMNAFAIVSGEKTDKGKTELDKVLTGMENINSNVTREEAAIFMAAFLGDCSNEENPDYFQDWDKVNDKGRIARLCEFGVMYGTEDPNTGLLYIEPTRPITRVEALVMLRKLIEIKADLLVKPASETQEEVTANDTTDPVITFTPNGGTVKAGAEVLFNVTDQESNITTVRYSWDNAVSTSIYSINQKTYSDTLKVPEKAGKHTLRMWARNAGGQSTGWKKVTYLVDDNAANSDLTPPTITFSIGDQKVGIFTIVDENADSGTIRAEDKESGISQIVYHWDNDPEKTVNTDNVTIKLPDNTDIIHYLYVKAQNGAGLWGEAKFEYKGLGKDYNDDKTGPEVSINTSLTQISTKDYIKITAKDNESGVKQIVYRWNNEQEIINECYGALEITIPAQAPQTKGSYTLYVKAENMQGVWSQEKTYTFDVVESNKPLISDDTVDYENDKTPPEVTINTTQEKLSIKDKVKITALDNESGVIQIVYRWDSNKEVAISCNALKMVLNIDVPQEEGTHYLYVKAKNGSNAGLWSQEVLKIFEVVKSDKPLVDEAIDSPVKVIVDGDEDDTIFNDGETGNIVEPGTELIITGEKPDEIVEIGYRWNNEEEKIVEGKEFKVKVPETEGVHYLYVRVKTEDGKWSPVRKYKFIVVEDEDDVKIKEARVEIRDAKTGDLAFNKVYIWKDIEDNKIVIKAPTKEGSYILYARVIAKDDNIIEAKKYNFKVEEEDDDESNLVGKTKLTKTGLVIQLTKDGKEVDDAGMVTYPGNPELIGAINPNVTSLRVEIRNADEKLMFEPKEEIKYYVDFYNGNTKELDNVVITFYIPEGFEAVSASDDGDISKEKIVWEIGKIKAGGGNRYTVVIKYTDDLTEDFSFVPEVTISIKKDLQDTSFVYNMIYKSGSSSAGTHRKYVVGYPDGSFQPQGTITRAEMAAMCSNLFGLKSYSGSAFSDLEENHWANSAINGCVAGGLIDTYGNYFDPNSPATRAIFCIALARQLGVADVEPIFINANDTAEHYARKEVEQLIRLGLVDGYPDGSAGPNNLVTRAEAVTMLNKYSFRGGLTLSNYGNYGSSYVFTDLSTGHWALNQILEAALDHNYTRTTNGEEKSY